MFNRLRRPDGFLSPHAQTNTPLHEAEGPAPSHSRVGELFRRAVNCACPALSRPQTAKHPEAGEHDWHGEVVRQQAPLFKRTGYQDLIGVFVAKPAKVIPVLSAIRYQGQLPMSEQPTLDKPYPWLDPRRGRP